MIHVHKSFSDIEQDVKKFYGVNTDRNAIDTALAIAGRALAVAAELQGGAELAQAKQIVFDAILNRVK